MILFRFQIITASCERSLNGEPWLALPVRAYEGHNARFAISNLM